MTKIPSQPRSSSRRIMSSSIGGLIESQTSWKLRIIARELGVTITKAAELSANHFAAEHGISFEEIPQLGPLWLIQSVKKTDQES